MNFLATTLGLAGIALAAPVAAATPMQAEDLYSLSMVINPAVASDGRRVLFTRAAFDRGIDRQTRELWLAHVDSAGRIIDKRLLVGRDTSPRHASFSPDGSRIAYVAQHLGKAQLHVMALADGVGRVVTTGAVEPVALAWAPDGRRIAFTGRVEEKPPGIKGMPEPVQGPGTDRAPDPKLISDLFWRADGAGERKPGADHLFVVTLYGSTVTRLTEGPNHQINPDGGLGWMPDGRHIIGAFTADPVNGPREIDLYRYATDKPGAPVRITSRPGAEYAPEVSPDGSRIAFLGSAADDQFYGMPTLWLTPASPGGTVTHLTAALDRPVAQFAWRADGNALHALYHDQGVTRVASVDAGTGATRVLVPVVGGTRLYLPSAGGEFSAGGGTFAWTSAHGDRPPGLAVSLGGPTTGTIDFNADWANSRTPARIAEVNAASRADGLPVQGWIAYPPDFDPKKRYPLILDIHGGPNTDYGPFFSITHSLYAAAGYIVLFANPRGSIGYGAQFANAITRAYPGRDHDDLMSITDAVAARPYVDGRNLYIGGGSGGGVLTLWAIGEEPDKFRAAVALRPVVDWTDQVTTSDATAFFMKHWMQATPWDDPERYFRLSPFRQAGRITTPTLLITGEEDYRTPISQTEQMFGALKLRGVDARMVRLPGAGHGMGRPSQWLQSILAPIQWFDEHRAE